MPGWFGSKKKEEPPAPPKPKSFNEMNKEEQKDMQDHIKKD